MMDGSFTYMDWKYYAKGDTFNLNNYDYYEGGVVAPQSGGSGITDVFVNSRWMGKLAGLYQFPYGINASFTFLAREGYVYPTYVKQNIADLSSDYNLYGNVGRRRQVRRPPAAQLLRAQLHGRRRSSTSWRTPR